MKKILILLGGMIITVLGCSNQIGEEEILKGMSDYIELHPTENLEDFFEKEGLIDNNFSEGDKGTWTLATTISKMEGDILKTEGIFSEINRNTKEITGKYVQRAYSGKERIKREEYPLAYTEGKFESTENVELKNLEDFKMLVQVIELNEEYFESLEKQNERYVSQRPLYSLNYVWTKEDSKLKKVMETYDIEEIDQPTIQLYGNGPLEGNSYNERQLNLTLNKNQKLKINSSVTFGPDRGGAND